MRSPPLIAPALLWLGLSTGAPAQTVLGVVVDESTRGPIPLATVSLLDANALVASHTRADERGAFRLHASSPGAYWLRLEHDGYRFTESAPFVLDHGDSLTTTLAASPGALAASDPAARAGTERNRNYASFMERRRFGRGLYRGPEELARSPVGRLSAAVAAMVATLPLDAASGRPAMRARACEPVVFLDGVRQGLAGRDGPTVDILSLVPPHQVRALEVYADPTLVPNELWIGANGCGAVAVWTHDALGDSAPVARPAVAQPAAAPSRSASSPRSRPDLITRAELESAAATNLYDVVRTLRPNWLRTRATTFSAAERCAIVLNAAERRDCQSRMMGSGVQLHVDNLRLAGVDDLRAIPLAGVAYIQYFNATEAGARWGLDHTQGAILVVTDTR